MMTSHFSALYQRIGRFAKETRGSINIEGIIFFPFLLMLIASSIVFYDAFRRDSLSQKAAYTIGDMISRETNAITPTYLDNTQRLLALMSDVPRSDVSVRVTIVRFNATKNQYLVDWSKERGSHTERLRSRDTRNMHEALPTMVHNERLIVVDTFVDYKWPIDLGLDDHIFESTVFTRPRFAPKVVWNAES